jgi:hypothetical protein
LVWALLVGQQRKAARCWRLLLRFVHDLPRALLAFHLAGHGCDVEDIIHQAQSNDLLYGTDLADVTDVTDATEVANGAEEGFVGNKLKNKNVVLGSPVFYTRARQVGKFAVGFKHVFFPKANTQLRDVHN